MIATPNPVKSASPVKVVIIDDSVVVRGMISRWIETESDIVLSGYGTDGVNGIEKVRSLQPDLVILDQTRLEGPYGFDPDAKRRVDYHEGA